MVASSSLTPEPDTMVSSASETAKVSTFWLALPNRVLTGALRANIDGCRRLVAKSGFTDLSRLRPLPQWPATSCAGMAHSSVKVGGTCGFALVSLTSTMDSPGSRSVLVRSRAKPFRSPSTSTSRPASLWTRLPAGATARARVNNSRGVGDMGSPR
jgi:hypothetical protein